jgi:two-component system NtrC family sensor kinase
VSDLLAFSRRSKPQQAEADLNKIVRTTLSLIAHKLKLNNLEVQTDFAADLPPVSCDSSQIQQVVLNLLLNASEATQTHDSGRIAVRTSLGPAGKTIVLEVTDDGEGIAPENMAKIFDPFFTTKPEGKGVGLGLAVSYGIVQEHGGDVEVKSKVGEGTTFLVTLPVTQIAVSTAAAGHPG